MANRSRQRAVRNLQLTARTLDKAASALFRWATTDHSGIGRALKLMPKRGFFDSLLDNIVCFLIAVFGAVVQGVWIYLLIAYGIPFLIFGHF